MDVKTAGRTIELFEAFASLRRPASLSELAAAMGIPMSSCFALVRTIQTRGYLYAPRPRGPLYPTGRLLQVARTISANDPVILRVSTILGALRDQCNETVVIGALQADQVVYVDVFESHQAIRYMPSPGNVRLIHANSIGKAIVGHMPATARSEILKRLSWKKYTRWTITSAKTMEEDLRRSARRGWYTNIKESVPDLAAVSMAAVINGDLYGVSIAGPLHRMQPNLETYGRAVAAACAKIADQNMLRRG